MWAPDGAVYEGDYVAGLRTGHGTYVNTQGTYKGEWANDLRHGKGVLTLKNGTKLDATFVNNHPEGRGFLKFPDGSEYEGNFKVGAPFFLSWPNLTVRRVSYF